MPQEKKSIPLHLLSKPKPRWDRDVETAASKAESIGAPTDQSILEILLGAVSPTLAGKVYGLRNRIADESLPGKLYKIGTDFLGNPADVGNLQTAGIIPAARIKDIRGGLKAISPNKIWQTDPYEYVAKYFDAKLKGPLVNEASQYGLPVVRDYNAMEQPAEGMKRIYHGTQHRNLGSIKEKGLIRGGGYETGSPLLATTVPQGKKWNRQYGDVTLVADVPTDRTRFWGDEVTLPYVRPDELKAIYVDPQDMQISRADLGLHYADNSNAYYDMLSQPSRDHRAAVIKAMQRGRQVPENVLKHYPELNKTLEPSRGIAYKKAEPKSVDYSGWAKSRAKEMFPKAKGQWFAQTLHEPNGIAGPRGQISYVDVPKNLANQTEWYMGSHILPTALAKTRLPYDPENVQPLFEAFKRLYRGEPKIFAPNKVVGGPGSPILEP